MDGGARGERATKPATVDQDCGYLKASACCACCEKKTGYFWQKGGTSSAIFVATKTGILKQMMIFS